jgi:hypothetical protein
MNNFMLDICLKKKYQDKVGNFTAANLSVVDSVHHVDRESSLHSGVGLSHVRLHPLPRDRRHRCH